MLKDLIIPLSFFLAFVHSEAQVTCLKNLAGKKVLWSKEFQRDHSDNAQIYRIDSIKIEHPQYNPETAVIELTALTKAHYKRRTVRISRPPVAELFCRHARDEYVAVKEAEIVAAERRVAAEEARRRFLDKTQVREATLMSGEALRKLRAVGFDVDKKVAEYRRAVVKASFADAERMLREFEEALHVSPDRLEKIGSFRVSNATLESSLFNTDLGFPLPVPDDGSSDDYHEYYRLVFAGKFDDAKGLLDKVARDRAERERMAADRRALEEAIYSLASEEREKKELERRKMEQRREEERVRAEVNGIVIRQSNRAKLLRGLQ